MRALGFGVLIGVAVLAMAVGAIAGTSRLDPTGLSALRLAHGGSVGSAPALLASSLGQSLMLFVIFAIVFGALLCWLRLRTESIWPAVFAHAANNTVVIGFVNVAVTDVEAVEPVDPWSFGLSGWPGWLVMGLLLAALVLVQRRRRYARRHVPVADRVQQKR